MSAIPKDPASVPALMARLRATLASAGTPPLAGGVPRRRVRAHKASIASRLRPSFNDRLASGVAGIKADNPQRDRQILRVFLEVALVDEWGESLRLDPAFPQWVDRVQAELQSDPELQELAGAVCRLLASHATGGSCDANANALA